jgi:hypothetical protein
MFFLPPLILLRSLGDLRAESNGIRDSARARRSQTPVRKAKARLDQCRLISLAEKNHPRCTAASP